MTSRRIREPVLPVREHLAHRPAEELKLANLRFERGEPLGGDGVDTAAGWRVLLPATEEGRELAQREAASDGIPDDRQSLERGFRILPIAVGRAPRRRQQSQSLVVAHRVGTDAGLGSQLPDAKRA